MKQLYRTFDEYLTDLIAENVENERMKARVRNALVKYRITDLDSFAALTVQDALKWDGFGKESVSVLIDMGVRTEPRVPSEVVDIVDVVALTEENSALKAIAIDMCAELRDLNDGGIATDCMEYEARLKKLGIEMGETHELSN